MDGLLSAETALTMMQSAKPNTPTVYKGADIERIEKSAREFEAVFIAEMMKPMFEGLETNELFGGGKGEEIFNGMLLQEYGKEIAKRDIIGIASQVQNKLIEIQAQQSK